MWAYTFETVGWAVPWPADYPVDQTIGLVCVPLQAEVPHTCIGSVPLTSRTKAVMLNNVV